MVEDERNLLEHKKQSLRERKKHATRMQLMDAALDLFDEHGFDNVTVAQIAAKAEVSKMTVFNYFSNKEELLLAGPRHHVNEPVDVVRNRDIGQTPVNAMRDYILDAIETHQPMMGMSDVPTVQRVQRLIHRTPSLLTGLHSIAHQTQENLIALLIEEGTGTVSARIMAGQILGAKNALSGINMHRILAGATPDEIHEQAINDAIEAFDLVENGLSGLLVKA